MTSHELFGVMPRSLAEDILDFAHSQEKAIYRGAIDAVAAARKVRPVFLERQSRTARYDLMVTSLSRPGLEVAADGLIRNWLLKKHPGLLAAFMDALGIQHENGVVNDLPKSVDDARLRNAVEAILVAHPAEVVTVYLNAFNGMNGESWSNLEALLKTEPRLQWGPSTPALGS